MKLSTDQTNYLNIGLMVLSCAIAFIYPFELFLFSYAVLGPLHYLTEISWLHDRKYFADSGRKKRAKRARRYWLLLIAATMIVLLYGLVAEKVLGQKISPKWEIAMFYLVFATAALLNLAKSTGIKLAVVLLALFALVLFNASRY